MKIASLDGFIFAFVWDEPEEVKLTTHPSRCCRFLWKVAPRREDPNVVTSRGQRVGDIGAGKLIAAYEHRRIKICYEYDAHTYRDLECVVMMVL